MINRSYIGDKRTNIDLPYVITTNGDIIVGKRNGNGRDGLATPHPTLIGGRNPEVTMAGMLHIHGGKIDSYDTNSGHFKPNIITILIHINLLVTYMRRSIWTFIGSRLATYLTV